MKYYQHFISFLFYKLSYQMHWTKVKKKKLMQSFLVILYIPQNTSDNSNHENTVY